MDVPVLVALCKNVQRECVALIGSGLVEFDCLAHILLNTDTAFETPAQVDLSQRVPAVGGKTVELHRFTLVLGHTGRPALVKHADVVECVFVTLLGRKPKEPQRLDVVLLDTSPVECLQAR
jgi:hypothetical protein